jgi:TolA-binding protein
VAPIIERIGSGCASNLMRVLICLTAPSEIALTLLWLGESQFHQAKFYDAEQNLQKALSLQTAQYSERHVKLKRVLELLRDVSVALGKDTDAQNFAEKIKSLEKL